MFTQDHKADFEAVLAAAEPFAMVRFGDGEAALIDGASHKSADAWSVEGESWLRDELISTLRTTLPGFALGLPPACCLSRALRLRASACQPLHLQTLATIFMHGNLPRVYEIQLRYKNSVLVNHEYGEIRVPKDGVSKKWDVDGVVEKLLEIRDRPILLAAGPCSNILAYRYWKRQRPEDRVPILDVGSVLDVLHGKINRYYHGQMNEHHCTWDHPSVAREKLQDAGVRRQGIRSGSPRIATTRIGRPRQGSAVSGQRMIHRIRIGKP